LHARREIDVLGANSVQHVGPDVIGHYGGASRP
jgi:hypothetical protein